ncbi:MAG TPA: YceD family protein [Actinomycetota bacterium]|jgi:uncharacterized protein|nr:YceD family protein [Actinomycetota bacterium]
MVMRAIDVRDLVESPGSSKTVRVDEAVEGLHMELAEVPGDQRLSGDLTLESVVDGVYATGTIRGTMALRCARCLKEFTQPFDVEMHELFPIRPGPEDDYGLEEDLTLDPEQMVRDSVVLSMPFSPLCTPDCLGLCPRCGGDRNLGQCTCTEEVVDPRWAGLEQLFRDP